MTKTTCTFPALFLLACTANANPGSELLDRLTPAERANALANLLRQSDRSCSTATRVFKQGADRDGAVYWNVECSNGNAYAIQINNDAAGTTRMLECSIMASMGIPCFTEFES